MFFDAEDFRAARRHLRRHPGFAALAIGALALGVGATTAIFSLLDAVMLRPLPYADPATLWQPHLATSGSAQSPDRPVMHFSWLKFTTFAEAQQGFSALGVYTDMGFNLVDGGEPVRIRAELASPGYFTALAVRPIEGRLFSEAEQTPGGPLAVLVAESLWRGRYGADPGLVGRTLTLDPHPVQVVGILPASFAGLSDEAQLWLPLAAGPKLIAWPEMLDHSGNHFLEAVARAKPGWTPEQLRADAASAALAAARAWPVPPDDDDGTVWAGGARTLAEARQDPMLRRSLGLLFAAVVGILLVACANLAGLQLARASGRGREHAVRAALGAGRRRLIGQALAETALVALGGGLAGLALAWLLVGLLVGMAPRALPTFGLSGADLQALAAATLDARVFLFAAGATALATLLAGLAPALAAARVAPADVLRQGGAALAGAAGHGRQRARATLVVAQVAVAIVLLVAAGLLLRSLDALLRIDPGFRADGVLAVRMVPASGSYQGEGETLALHSGVLERVRALPGVVSASVGTCLPLGLCNGTIVRQVDDRVFGPGEGAEVGAHNVGPDHFRTLGIPVLAGREFAETDRLDRPRVAIVNHTAATRLWPGLEAGALVGRRINVGMNMERGETAEVVGVVGDTRYDGLTEAVQPAVFLADFQSSWPAAQLLVRAEGDAMALLPAIRGAVAGVAPQMPLVGAVTLEEQLARGTSRARFAALLIGAFAATALLLAALGLYGVLAQAVSDRRRELGLRAALGASPPQLVGMVLRRGLLLALAGAAIGLPAAAAATRLLSSLLFQVPANDLGIFLAVPALVLTAAALACWLPARRAAALDPAAVLRAD